MTAKIKGGTEAESPCHPTLELSVSPTPAKPDTKSRDSSKSPLGRLHTETISSQLKRLEKMAFSKEKKPPLLIKKNAISPTKITP
jgi:hypothetical protein